ncbi:hypothetical protein EDB87DRAFT_332385 [Lactarius vividus]|nr:hypothetical protein EDB87DRAFT_332385 [Lactarius vividus]
MVFRGFVVSQGLTLNSLEESTTRSNNNAMAAEPDYVVEFNNRLQKSPEGNVAAELTWAMIQDGPNNNAIHTATAIFRGVTLGSGKGLSKGLAKRAAAKQAVPYLDEHGLPEKQCGPPENQD